MKRIAWIVLGCLSAFSLQAEMLESKLISYGDKVVRVFENGKIETVLAANKPKKDGYPEISNAVASPNQKLIAYIHNFNLWLFDVETKKSTQLTTVGKQDSRRFAAILVELRFWSRDGTKLFYELDHGLADDPEGGGDGLEIREAEYGNHVYELSTKHDEIVDFPIGTGIIYRWLASGDFLFEQQDSTTRVTSFIRYTPKPSQSQNSVNPVVESPPGQMVFLSDISNDSKYMLAIEEITTLVQPSLYKKYERIAQYDLATHEKTYLSGVAESTWIPGSAELSGGFGFANPTYSPSKIHMAYLHYEYHYNQYDGHTRKVELLVDGKQIYSMNENQTPPIYWINESTIAILKSNIKNQRVILVFDANSGLKKNIQIIE